MTTGYYFSLAGENDNAALCALAKNIGMEGPLCLTFSKDPDFFRAEKLGASSLDVITVRERETDRVVGFGSRSIRNVFMNGVPREIGYLSSLRGLPEVRKGTLLARAYKMLKRVHEDGKVPCYFTTILEDNEYAKAMLTSGRAGLPRYTEAGPYHTYLFDRHIWNRDWRDAGFEVDHVPATESAEILEFINAENQRYQFAPHLRLEDFAPEGIFSPYYAPKTFFVARKNGLVVAAAAPWDQYASKQIIVERYNPALSLLRYGYNAYAYWRRMPRLPRAGSVVRPLFISFLAVREGCFDAVPPLLGAIIRYYDAPIYHSVVMGFNAEHSLAKLVSREPHYLIKSRIYMVDWNNGANVCSDGRMAQPEVSLL